MTASIFTLSTAIFAFLLAVKLTIQQEYLKRLRLMDVTFILRTRISLKFFLISWKISISLGMKFSFHYPSLVKHGSGTIPFHVATKRLVVSTGLSRLALPRPRALHQINSHNNNNISFRQSALYQKVNHMQSPSRVASIILSCCKHAPPYHVNSTRCYWPY